MNEPEKLNYRKLEPEDLGKRFLFTTDDGLRMDDCVVMEFNSSGHYVRLSDGSWNRVNVLKVMEELPPEREVDRRVREILRKGA